MTALSPLAQSLNADLQDNGSRILQVFSEKGKSIYFPSKGILGQSAEAKAVKINATIGTAFEEDGSPLTLECMESAVNLPSDAFLYAPSFGNPKLREEWAKLLVVKNPGLQGKSFSSPVVTAALTHALSVAGYLFLNPGDEVIIPDLYWDNYELVFGEAFGAKLVTHNTFTQGGYDIAAFAQALNKGAVGKKVVLLNFPNNPTGYTVTEAEAKLLIAEIRKAAEAGNQIVVLLDDAYFGLVYGAEVAKESLFSALVDLHPDVLAVKLDGPTKEDYVWGFRVGFITMGFQGATPAQLKALENKAAGAVRGNISNAPSISQAILLKGYASPQYAIEKKQKFEILAKRVALIHGILDTHPEYAQSFTVMPFNSGYFMCVKPIGVDAEALRKLLIAEYSTGVIVLAGLVRIAFSAVPSGSLASLFHNIDLAIRKMRES